MELLADVRCFGGQQKRFKHASTANNCEMTFSIYFPPGASASSPVPLIYWLSGLTCTDENFVQKAGAQRYAAEHKVAIVCPDTSPRGEGVPDDEQGAWDFGLGAGFYVDATQTPWSKNYNMYSYVSHELPALIEKHFAEINGKRSIMGHSMGGHGALILALKNPDRYHAVSAFAPICSPLNSPWGEKALGNYIGSDKNLWQAYDSCALLESTDFSLPILVDQGEMDNFLQEQLKPELLEAACKANNISLNLRYQPGYDHSYFFIASFIGEHIKYHADTLHR